MNTYTTSDDLNRVRIESGKLLMSVGGGIDLCEVTNVTMTLDRRLIVEANNISTVLGPFDSAQYAACLITDIVNACSSFHANLSRHSPGSITKSKRGFVHNQKVIYMVPAGMPIFGGERVLSGLQADVLQYPMNT